jgi:hypothetical protein
MASWKWPEDLPQTVEEGSYREIPQTNMIRSPMDAGPAKRRRRFTRRRDQFQFNLHLTAAELEIFENFAFGTCSGAVDKFSWVHPRTGFPAEFAFLETPSWSGDEGYFLVTFKLERTDA